MDDTDVLASFRGTLSEIKQEDVGGGGVLRLLTQERSANAALQRRLTELRAELLAERHEREAYGALYCDLAASAAPEALLAPRPERPEGAAQPRDDGDARRLQGQLQEQLLAAQSLTRRLEAEAARLRGVIDGAAQPSKPAKAAGYTPAAAADDHGTRHAAAAQRRRREDAVDAGLRELEAALADSGMSGMQKAEQRRAYLRAE